jgi:hypothetical protein
MAAESSDRLGRGTMVPGNHLAPFFRVEPSGNFCRAHEIAKEHRKMASLAASRRCYGCGICSGCRRCLTQCGAAFTAEAFAQLDGSAAFGARGNEGCPASRTEFAPFAIIAAAFRTAHIAPLWLRWVL